MLQAVCRTALALGSLIWLLSCSSSHTATPMPPTPTWTPSHTPHLSATTLPTATTAPTWTPAPTPTSLPTPTTDQDAWLATFYPWASDPPTLPEYVGEGKARVINSIILDAPPFFGFDIHPGEQWYHVIGAEHWATVNGQRISPTINHARPLRDSEPLWIHGHADGEFLLASYVGFGDGIPYYYRSLLRADELRSDVLPQAYNGLTVWVRGALDVAQGQGRFYSLPAGTWIDSDYLGHEALVAGTLSMGEQIRVEVSKGIFLPSDNKYVNLWRGQTSAPAERTYLNGAIRTVGAPDQSLLVENDDQTFVQVDVTAGTRIEFADGSEASFGELSVGQRIDVSGHSFGAQRLTADKLTIISISTAGSMFVAYLMPSGELWSLNLEDLTLRRIAAPNPAAPNLAEAQFSPDGSRFVFSQSQDVSSTLRIGDLQTGVLREWLTEDDWQESDPTWSPDGNRIAFCRHRDEEGKRVDGGLWIANLKDGSTRRVGAGAPEGWKTVKPQWSPNGRSLAFGQSGESESQATKLYVLSFPSQNQWVLDWVSEWRWSLDSAQLLTTRRTSEEAWARLWVVQRDGTSPTWLSIRNVHDYGGRWSPDGTAIAFLSRGATSSGPDALWIMQANGMRRFQPPQLPLASELAWSPDSQSVVFLRVSSLGQNDGLWIVGRDGAGLRRLASDASALVGTYREP